MRINPYANKWVLKRLHGWRWIGYLSYWDLRCLWALLESPYSSAIFLRCTPSRIEIEGRCSIGHEAHGKSVESRQILLRQDSSE